MKTIIISALLLLNLPIALASQQWNLNDVSYLFPIPNGEASQSIQLLKTTDSGMKGSLMPQEIYQQIPTLLNAGKGNPTLYKEALRVVSFRFDPCPAGNSKCQPELRLVWQPIEYDTRYNKWLTRDATVHSFYSLSDKQFKSVKEKLWDLKRANEAQGVSTHKVPLGVHPALVNSVTYKTTNKQLQEILVSTCGEKNLFKVTFMSLLVPTRWWRFGGFEKSDQGQWARFVIPRLESALDEDLFNVALEEGTLLHKPGKEMDAIFNILPEDYPEKDNIFALINKSYRKNDDNDYMVFKEKLGAIERFRNPYKTHAKNLDCASCHYADASKYYALKRFPQLAGEDAFDRFINPNPNIYELKNTTIADKATRVVRAFGYFVDQPAVNQRVINDSAVSAEWLNNH